MRQTYTIVLGDAERTLDMFKHASFDACQCDPPYGYTAFRGKGTTQAWEEAGVPSHALWEHIFDVLRPGALLFAATGAKNYDLIASPIRACGFVMMDQFNWIYTSSSATGVKEGYRLKPATEPYVVAMKPRLGTVKQSRRRGGLGGVLNGSVRVNGHLASNVAIDPGVAALIRPHEGFFFCGKPGANERGEGNDHPTLKPFTLTEHIARLELQPGARRILVPFSGSGSEVIGCLRAGWPEVVGLEQELKYVRTARRRIPQFVGRGAVEV